MHNWRLLILLIPSLLQPILSEHSFIYGRQYCIHSSRSLADERFLHGKHRFGKPTSNGERLVDQRPTDQFGIRRYRSDVRDVEPIRFSSEQHSERSNFVSDDRSPVVHVRRHRTSKDVSQNVQRKIVREQNYKNFRNAPNIATSLYARLPHEDRERESREHSGHRFDTRLDTRGSHIRHSRQEDSERIGKSNTDRKYHVLTRNFRNEHAHNRQRYRDLNLHADIPQDGRNTDSLERNIRKRDLDGDFNRDIARIETRTDLRRERDNIRNNERNANDRAINRNIVRSKHTLNSDIRNKLENRNNNERHSRENVRERTIVSIEDHNVGQINDRQVIRGRYAASFLLERDNRQNGRTYTLPNQKSNIISNIDRTDEKNNERSLRRIIRERTVSAERFVSQSDESMVTDMRSVLNREETNRNKRDVRTDTRNGRRYSKNNIGERENSMERDMHRSDTRKMNTHNAKESEVRTNLRSKRTEEERIRNAERHARDNYRDETYYRGVREYRERISEKQLTPRRDEPNNNIKHERTNNRNSEQYSRDIDSDRSISVDREARKLDSRLALDLSTARSRNERDLNTRVERIRIRNDERHSREHIRERVISNEHDARQTETKRASDVRSREARSREELNTNNKMINRYSRGINERRVLRSDIVRSNRNVQNIRSDIRNGERYSHEKDFDEREILRSDVRRITDENKDKSHKERNIRVRVERDDVRYAERYGEDNNRERTLFLNRDVRERDRLTDQHLTHNRNARNTNIHHLRMDIKYSYNNIRGRSVSFDREVRDSDVRRVTDLQSRRSREERNTREVRDSDERRVTDLQSHRSREERNIREVRDSDVRRVTDLQSRRSREERNIREVRDSDVRRVTDLQSHRSREERNMREVRDSDVRRVTDLQSHRSRDERNIREVRDSDVRRVTDLQSHRGREERNMYVRNKRYEIRDHERYSRDVTHERATLMERSEDGRQPLTMRIEDRQITRGKAVQNLDVRKERSNVRYVRDDRNRDTSTRFNDRELREMNGRRILQNQMNINDDSRSYSRNREQNFRDFTHERISESVGRDRIVDNGKLERLRHLTSTERRTERDQIRNRDNSAASLHFTRNHRISQEQTRNTDYVRSSDAHVSESRKATAMRSSALDLYREREMGIRAGDRSSRFIDMRRDYVSRQNSEFTNALRTMTRGEPTVSAIKPTEKQFNEMFYLQYIFYAVQGIYIFGILIQVFKEKENSKASSMGWLIPTRLVKLD